jgi:glycosyltransferase involved in cell wall biosynthesis
MGEQAKRVSVGLPVYNGEDHIVEAIRSFQDQTFDDFELIVSDNASEDGTEKLVRDLAADDPRIRYHRSDVNIGANRNYNRTFALATGELFKWAAHDDTLEPTYLARCVEVLDDDPSVVLVHSDTRYIGADGEGLLALARGFLGTDGYVERLVTDDRAAAGLASERTDVRFDTVVNHMTAFFDIFGVGRRRAFLNTLLLRTYYGADKVFLAEMALEGRIGRVPEELFNRRCHDGTSSRVADLERLASWSDPGGGLNYYPLLMMAGYVDAVRATDLPASTKARCLLAVASKIRNPMKLARGR